MSATRETFSGRAIILLLLFMLALIFLFQDNASREEHPLVNNLSKPEQRRYLKENSFELSTKQSLEDVVESLIIIGDAGDPNPDLLKVLKRQAALLPEITTVAFLGDNIYHRGLPDQDHAHREIAENRILQQIQAVQIKDLKAFFIPGNHDWQRGRSNGWLAIKRQQQFVESKLGEGSFLPQGGCPGPVVAYESPRLRLIVFDSQWWLHSEEKPGTENSECRAANREGAINRLTKLLGEKMPGRRDIYLQHHPLKSFGRHGIQSRCPQDVGCQEYTQMRDRLWQALANNPPLICAAGHDHSLQLIEGDQRCRHYLVSGAGSYPTNFREGKGLVYGFYGFGFFRLDVYTDSRVRLAAIVLDSENQEREDLAFWLDSGSLQLQPQQVLDKGEKALNK